MGCPICGHSLNTRVEGTDPVLFNCIGCGSFVMGQDAIDDLPALLHGKKFAAPLLSHALRNITESNRRPNIQIELLEKILKSSQLPSPQEQLERLIIWFGRNQETPTSAVRPSQDTLAYIGAIDNEGLYYVAKRALDLKLISGPLPQTTGGPTFMPTTLTFDGWEYLNSLQKGKVHGRQAFMAMPFGNPQLDNLFMDHLKPAVFQTGFTLKRLDEEPKAGLIDDQLRVEIRQSKFLIAELTEGNCGAYWEAGYAEGLGKPVIYICSKEYFDQNSTHFDTNHHLTVIWDEADIEAAMERLKSTIRATLPEDAKLLD